MGERPRITPAQRGRSPSSLAVWARWIPRSSLGSRGWGNVHFSGVVGVLTRRRRGSPGLTPWEGHAGRGRVGGTPELHIVVGVDDNLSLLPSTSLGGGLGVGGPGLPRISSGS